MKILSMTATFGKLENATLNLHDGLNPVAAPNEWGKSTWCAFLLAMFYGIDTRERSTNTHLADKEKYMPWSGHPMEGRIRLEFEGRDITIERKTQGRTPMGDFRAYETRTGLTVPELTAANCGKVLLGVDRHVFQRTGFIRFSDLPVAGDEILRDRLNSLVTTGDDTGQAELLAKKLRELKNRCRYKRSGLIPECQAQIRSLQDTLQEHQTLMAQYEATQNRIGQLEQELNKLENHRNILAYEDAQSDQARVYQARNSLQSAQHLAQMLEQTCQEHPPRAELQQKLSEGEALIQELEASERRPTSSLWPTIILCCFAAAFGLMALLMPELVLWFVSGMLLCIVAAGFWLVYQHRAQLEYTTQLSHAQARREELEQAMTLWSKQLMDLNSLDDAQRSVQLARDHLEILLEMARTVVRPEEPDELTLSRDETIYRIRSVNQQLRDNHLQLAQLDGRLESLPDPEALTLQLEIQTRRLAELEQTWQALNFAQKALEAALQELQRRFAPRITRLAGQFLTRLTRGKYDRISIGEDLDIQAAQPTEPTLRPAQWRSDGTGDQMYLALRLAVWEVLAPNALLVLDDALVRFDQSRMEAALDLLMELAQDRQILLLSCHGREKRYINRNT